MKYQNHSCSLSLYKGIDRMNPDGRLSELPIPGASLLLPQRFLWSSIIVSTSFICTAFVSHALIRAYLSCSIIMCIVCTIFRWLLLLAFMIGVPSNSALNPFFLLCGLVLVYFAWLDTTRFFFSFLDARQGNDFFLEEEF